MSSECGEYSEDKTEFLLRHTNTHLLLSEHCTPKGTSYPFIWTLSTPASLCVKMRAGIQKTCTDGASSLLASPSPLPPTPLKAARGSGTEAAGFFLFPTRSRSLSFSLLLLPLLFLARQVPGDRLCCSSRELIWLYHGCALVDGKGRSGALSAKSITLKGKDADSWVTFNLIKTGSKCG